MLLRSGQGSLLQTVTEVDDRVGQVSFTALQHAHTTPAESSVSMHNNTVPTLALKNSRSFPGPPKRFSRTLS